MAKKKAQNLLGYKDIPNILSVGRIVLTFIVVYLILTNSPIVEIVIIFSIAAFTDFLDGKLARRFKWKSEFGRKIDIIADRILWVGTALAFLIVFGIKGRLAGIYGIQLLLVMTREVMTLPFAMLAFFSNKHLPHARFSGKLTTLAQGFALPSLILSTYYLSWLYISWPLSVVCCILGFKSALHYMYDVKK